jgi:hypothetical protein
MKKRFCLFILLMSFVLGCGKDDSGTQSLPDKEYGVVIGKITANLSSLPIQNATITVESDSSISTFTDSLGNYTISAITAGTCRLIVSKNGFITDTVSVSVTAFDTVGCNSTLTYLIPTNGLISYYRFDGNAIDLGNGGNSGIVNNLTPTFDRFGNPNRAYSYNGSSSYINLGTGSSLNPPNGLTFSVWINYNGGSNYRAIISRWDVVDGVNERTYVAGVSSDNRLYFQASRDGIHYGSVTIQDTAVVSITGNWVHIVATWDGSVMRLYKNGSQCAVGLLNAMCSSPDTRTGIGAAIGRVSDSGISFFNGNIDDIRFYNRALSQEEIQILYAEQ